jgi:serine/threonine protein kinase
VIGKTLGPYQVLSKLGEGGMGEVYGARDTRLKRDVAIKVLPAAFATESDRLVRFQREAELLATLNHPNIAAVYGLETIENSPALVLELVEGDTLADLISRGPMAIDDALAIARQLGEALEAAQCGRERMAGRMGRRIFWHNPHWWSGPRLLHVVVR